MHNICELPRTSPINHINILSMKRIIWRGNRAHDLMSMQHASQASFFASQHFDAHELTLKSCSRVLDLMQIRSMRIAFLADPYQASDFIDRRSALSDWAYIFTPRSPLLYHAGKKHLYQIFIIAYSVPVSIAIRSYPRRLRPRIVARGGDYRVRHPYASQRVSPLLPSLLSSPYLFLSFSKRLFKFATRNQRFSSFPSRFSIILQMPVLCFEDRRATWL